MRSGVRGRPGERDGRQGADQLGCQAGRQRERPAGRRPGGGWAAGRGEAGQGALPGDDALAREHAEAEREGLPACVQGGMAEFLVAGAQPAAGSGGLAGIRARARLSSRVAR
ncbi:MAG TPA: hypothetical protein VMG38_02095 [Trebonia sp.]|nr:hypothetical protein [Trebonia sp.]